MELLRSLREVGQHDIDLVGGKAANLGALLKKGLPVLPGYVLLTAAYQSFLIVYGTQAEIKALAEASALSRSASIEHASTTIRTLFERGTIPEDYSRGLSAYGARLGRGTIIRNCGGPGERFLRGPAGGLSEPLRSRASAHRDEAQLFVVMDGARNGLSHTACLF